MLARKFSSDGSSRWPMPWRARKATRLPRSVPITYGPEGSPNGVSIVFSSRSVSSAMSYKPLPPMMPIPMLIVIVGAFSRTQRLTDLRRNRALAVRFTDVAGSHLRVVFEEHQDVPLHGVADELRLRPERVHRIQI